MSTESLTLYSFAISHFSEKIRWTLDASGLKFSEVLMTPPLHVLSALRMGGKGETTLPILQVRQPGGAVEHIQDSTHILRWLDQHLGPLDVMPRHAGLNEDIMDIEERFDAIGKDVVRYLYHAALNGDDDRVIGMWTQHASQHQARLVRLFYPLTKWIFKWRLRITAEAAAQSALRIQQALAWLDGRLSDGRHYLVGHQFSVADITAASMLAPLACPDQHPIYGTAQFRQVAGHSPAWLGNRPCVEWVRRVYKAHRTGHPGLEAHAAA
ncbi:glutathione S-transferase [Aquabacterium sp.]|uniref:glutathione S-transferase family protein n=1 Tax=Aquabacterium sp. TaxID=1872578 RepID=UPI0025BC9166|nr:glutathione S-transferase [Aquabacterium sp.]